jgi:hypothetical protein
MTADAFRRIRAFVALTLLTMSGGGVQLADALVFHSGVARADVARVNAGDHCHAERCELGAPIASPPPLAPPVGDGRVEPPSSRVTALAPADAPRSAVVAGPLGSRAPPVRS